MFDKITIPYGSVMLFNTVKLKDNDIKKVYKLKEKLTTIAMSNKTLRKADR